MSLSLSLCSGEAAQGAQTQHSSEELGGPGTAHRWCPAHYKLVSRYPPSRKAPLEALRGTRKISGSPRAQCHSPKSSFLSPRSTNPSLPPSLPSIPVAAPVLLLHVSHHRGTVWCQVGSGPCSPREPEQTWRSCSPQPRNQGARNCAFNSIWRIFLPWTDSSRLKLGELVPAPAHSAPTKGDRIVPSFIPCLRMSSKMRICPLILQQPNSLKAFGEKPSRNAGKLSSLSPRDQHLSQQQGKCILLLQAGMRTPRNGPRAQVLLQ